MSATAKILVVDDEDSQLRIIVAVLAHADYEVSQASGATEAAKQIAEDRMDLVITDLKMPKVGGLDLVRHVRENFKDTEVVVITGYPSIEGAVEAVKAGAEEFLPKPFTNEELLSAVRRALDKLHLRRANQAEPERRPPAPDGLIAASEPMQEVFGAIEKAAATDAAVLISGESGTGKELVARAIHYGSRRSAAPFVPVNCGGIPEGLLESELFGHVKGAFTGATESRAGFFHAADGGTIFLDEVSETSPAMQVKLLRVLEDKEVCMVGSSRSRRADVRVLAATNKELLKLVRMGGFREDLFYRLNVIAIALPPLRERRGDVLLLARHFAEKFAAETNKPVPQFSGQALQVLRDYYWPGNVRELGNVIQRLVVMTDGDIIDVPDMPSLMRFSALRKAGFDRTLAEVEAEYIRNVLTSVSGNKTRAAEILGIDRKTLR
ncbi:MAG: sigma-54-dependent Fis family transcriptional regulator, partial [Candidatus Abyssubacteria bacterium]|nr:sigma-54-dependent Fis family transcriptional regulator [Candidatus Abyssubacteria bacterium]